MTSAAAYLPTERSKYGRDASGALFTSKDYDDDVQLVLDWSGYLGDDTISSVAYSDNGVTTSSKTNTTTTSTCTVTGLGFVDITITAASGRTYVQRVKYHDNGMTTNSYHGYDDYCFW